MIDQSMTRIIGDFLEVNSDIVAQEFNSKLPKFISKRISHKKRKKLLTAIEKFRKSEYILSWVNLIELFTYIYNSFEPDHNYGVVSETVLTSNKLEAIIYFDNYYCLIFFDQLPPSNIYEDIKFNLKMKTINANGNNGIDVYLSSLKGSSKRSQDLIEELNYVLKNTIVDYIEDVINKYMEGQNVL